MQGRRAERTAPTTRPAASPAPAAAAAAAAGAFCACRPCCPAVCVAAAWDRARRRRWAATRPPLLAAGRGPPRCPAAACRPLSPVAAAAAAAALCTALLQAGAPPPTRRAPPWPGAPLCSSDSNCARRSFTSQASVLALDLNWFWLAGSVHARPACHVVVFPTTPTARTTACTPPAANLVAQEALCVSPLSTCKQRGARARPPPRPSPPNVVRKLRSAPHGWPTGCSRCSLHFTSRTRAWRSPPSWAAPAARRWCPR